MVTTSQFANTFVCIPVCGYRRQHFREVNYVYQ